METDPARLVLRMPNRFPLNKAVAERCARMPPAVLKVAGGTCRLADITRMPRSPEAVHVVRKNRIRCYIFKSATL